MANDDVIDTIIGEAAGEGYNGMLAVAYSIVNRAETRNLTLSQTVQQKSQYSGFSNPGSSAKAARKDAGIRATAERALNDAVNKSVPDPTKGADYFAKSTTKPSWSNSFDRKATVGNNTFYQSPQARTTLANAPPMPERAPVAPAATAAAPAAVTAGALAAPSLTAPSLATPANYSPALATAPFTPEPVSFTPAPPHGLPGALSVPGVDISYQYNPDAPFGRSATQKMEPIAGAIMHHPGFTTAEQTVSYGNRVDPKRGASYGYTFVVDPLGNITQAAPLDARTNQIKGSASPQRTSHRDLSNKNTIGISFVGAEHGLSPAQQHVAQIDVPAMMQAMQPYATGFGINPGNVLGHGEVQRDRMRTEGKQAAELARAAMMPDSVPRLSVTSTKPDKAVIDALVSGMMPGLGPSPTRFSVSELGLPELPSAPVVAEPALSFPAIDLPPEPNFAIAQEPDLLDPYNPDAARSLLGPADLKGLQAAEIASLPGMRAEDVQPTMAFPGAPDTFTTADILGGMRPAEPQVATPTIATSQVTAQAIPGLMPGFNLGSLTPGAPTRGAKDAISVATRSVPNTDPRFSRPEDPHYAQALAKAMDDQIKGAIETSRKAQIGAAALGIHSLNDIVKPDEISRITKATMAGVPAEKIAPTLNSKAQAVFAAMTPEQKQALTGTFNTKADEINRYLSAPQFALNTPLPTEEQLANAKSLRPSIDLMATIGAQSAPVGLAGQTLSPSAASVTGAASSRAGLSSQMTPGNLASVTGVVSGLPGITGMTGYAAPAGYVDIAASLGSRLGLAGQAQAAPPSLTGQVSAAQMAPQAQINLGFPGPLSPAVASPAIGATPGLGASRAPNISVMGIDVPGAVSAAPGIQAATTAQPAYAPAFPGPISQNMTPAPSLAARTPALSLPEPPMSVPAPQVTAPAVQPPAVATPPVQAVQPPPAAAPLQPSVPGLTVTQPPMAAPVTPPGVPIQAMPPAAPPAVQPAFKAPTVQPAVPKAPAVTVTAPAQQQARRTEQQQQPSVQATAPETLSVNQLGPQAGLGPTGFGTQLAGETFGQAFGPMSGFGLDRAAPSPGFDPFGFGGFGMSGLASGLSDAYGAEDDEDDDHDPYGASMSDAFGGTSIGASDMF